MLKHIIFQISFVLANKFFYFLIFKKMKLYYIIILSLFILYLKIFNYFFEVQDFLLSFFKNFNNFNYEKYYFYISD